MRKEEYMEAFSQVHAPKALTEQLLQPKLRPNYTRKFAVLAACAVIASILGAVLMGAATETPPKETEVSIDWNMYAQLIRVENGEIEMLDQFEMGVVGDFHKPDAKYGIINIDIRFTMPEDFPLEINRPLGPDKFWHLRDYAIFKRLEGYENAIEDYPTPVPYYRTRFDSSKPIDGEQAISVHTDLAICVLEKYMVMCWNDGEPIYLVASLDPSAEPSAIMDYFHLFLEHGCQPDTDSMSATEQALQRIREEYRVMRENIEAEVAAGNKDTIANYQSLMDYLYTQEQTLVRQYEKILQENFWGKYK